METTTSTKIEESVSIQTPIGKIGVSGANLTLNTVMTLAILGIMAWVGAWIWVHKSDMETGRAQTNSILIKHDETQVKMIQAIKENTCILSLPPEKREAEFSAPNSLCKRMTQ